MKDLKSCFNCFSHDGFASLGVCASRKSLLMLDSRCRPMSSLQFRSKTPLTRGSVAKLDSNQITVHCSPCSASATGGLNLEESQQVETTRHVTACG